MWRKPPSFSIVAPLLLSHKRETLQKVFRCDSCPRCEQPMKVMLAQTNVPGERHQVGLVGVTLI
jgi:hypothetical protein